MGMLENSRHEAFAHAIARGATASAAYVEAGYVRNDGNASRLNGNDTIMERVGELKSLVQKMQNLSTHAVVANEQWVIEQLIGVVIDARAQEKPDSAGANKALNLIGLHIGMFVERKEVGKPGEFDGMTIATKRERVMGLAKQLGLDRISAADRLAFAGPVIDVETESDST